MAGKTYVARRGPDGLIVTVRTGEEEWSLRHIAYHSPTGMELGYPGSGPADLALSILVDALGEGPQWEADEGKRPLRTVPRQSRAWDLHQEFKRDHVQGADRSGVVITEEQVRAWIKEHSVEALDL